MRKVILRTSMVLSKDEGVLPRLKKLALSGLGGKQGNGKQMVSWIHQTDVCRMIEWIALNDTTEGIYNCTSPQPLSNAMLMKEVRKVYGVPFGLPAPAWLLAIGAAIIGTETELVLKSRWVIPARAQKEGFVFSYRQIDSCLRDLA